MHLKAQNMGLYLSIEWFAQRYIFLWFWSFSGLSVLLNYLQNTQDIRLSTFLDIEIWRFIWVISGWRLCVVSEKKLFQGKVHSWPLLQIILNRGLFNRCLFFTVAKAFQSFSSSNFNYLCFLASFPLFCIRASILFLLSIPTRFSTFLHIFLYLAVYFSVV